jgi:hypothetical protein
MTQGPEGSVTIRVRWDGAVIRGCEVDSQRPVTASRALQGRKVGEALALIPRLYAVCAQAQLAAGRSAVDAAQGALLLPEAGLRRRLAVLGETVAEYLWRFLIDLPQAFGETPVVAPVASLRSFLAMAGAPQPGGDGIDRRRWEEVDGVLATVLEEQVFGMAPERFAAIHTAADWDGWLRSGSGPTGRLLRRLCAAGYGPWGGGDGPLWGAEVDVGEVRALAAALADHAEFARRPYWHERVPETGALARNQCHPLIQALLARDGGGVLLRLVARLVEMARLAGELRALLRGESARPMTGNVALADGVGAGWVETARGRLLHRIELADGRVRDWRVLAPTEWNFHPEGPLAAGLSGTAVQDEVRLRRGVKLAVLALDPCVAYDLEVLRA